MDTSRWKVGSIKVDTAPTPAESPAWWKSAASPLSWWNQGAFPAFGNHVDFAPGSWIGIPFLRSAIEGGAPVRLCDWYGNLVVPGPNLLTALEVAAKVRVVRIQTRSNGNGEYVLTSDSAMIRISFAEQGRTAEVNLATIDEKVIRLCEKLFAKCLLPDDPRKGQVFTLVKGPGGYSVTRLGAVGTQLERGNYSTEVLKDYDHILADLRTESPCGRLAILAGPPGSGKTYLVRSLVSSAPQCAFVLVPPHLVEGLGGPEILPALMSVKSEFPGPIVLIIEDADQCLVQRKEGNMNAISAMLNLGDGILGAVLDVRILATTNADKIEMDPATRRPGRLCRYTEVGNLSAELATKALQRLTGKLDVSSEASSIAQVYAHARDLGWTPPPLEAKHPAMRMELLPPPSKAL